MITPQDKHAVNGKSSRKGESKRHQQTRRPASLYQAPLAIALMVAAVGSGTSVQAQSPADCAARADRAARNTGGVIGALDISGKDDLSGNAQLVLGYAIANTTDLNVLWRNQRPRHDDGKNPNSWLSMDKNGRRAW